MINPKNSFKASLIALSLALPTVTLAADKNSCRDYRDNKCYYDPYYAREYALKFAKVEADENNPSNWGYYFPEFKRLGGDCTNFANQAILAGLVGSTDPKKISENGKYFKDAGSWYEWYFVSKYSQSYSWRGAKELKSYAISNNNPNYKGLHFDFITEDSPTKPLEFSKIKEGDIIFVDWEGDGYTDHSMIVTYKGGNSYSSVYVSYKNDNEHEARKNISLKSINSNNTVFSVYRPTYFTDYGL